MVFIKPVAGNGYLVNDGFRSTDRILQLDLERILIEIYQTLNVPLLPVFSKKERR
jgi:hypothetical protein